MNVRLFVHLVTITVPLGLLLGYLIAAHYLGARPDLTFITHKDLT